MSAFFDAYALIILNVFYGRGEELQSDPGFLALYAISGQLIEF
jgi:hypothetical protein